MPLAHSARPELGISPQSYADHVRGVYELASRHAIEAAKYSRTHGAKLLKAIPLASEFHDLGKLDPENQTVLAFHPEKRRLPIRHQDAGVAHLLGSNLDKLLCASLVYAHHIGLPDFQDQRLCEPENLLRDLRPNNLGRTTKSISDQRLSDYLKLHTEVMRSILDQEANTLPVEKSGLSSMLFRIGLSCLVDADHEDTSRHYGQEFSGESPQLCPSDRLALLDKYTARLAEEKTDERTALRNQIYQGCRNANFAPGLFACDSPVGTGKTTAVMAHLLRVASVKGLRRIFVVLPFTNIIDQSVEVYRHALARPGEREEDVVAAHHHKAEFENLESRHLSFLWKAPIIVTTAVQFFETMAANRPSSLRKLHHLPGSAIFIDEAHAALPTHLWPQAWKWLCELESQWGCHFVLGSGSLNRFWEFEEFAEAPRQLPNLIPNRVKTKVVDHEKHRVQYKSRSDCLNQGDLLQWLPDLLGPRLLIVNTVQSAAVLAASVAEQHGRDTVEHLSTSLCPRDRKTALDRIKKRLNDSLDNDWTMVATSCVEAGVNLSFRNGLRERCSLNSLIQVGGRVNREGEYSDSEVWDFELQHDGFLKAHPAFDTSSRILGELFREENVCAEASTEAMRREIRQEGLKQISDTILRSEKSFQFPSVSEKFRVIDTDTVTVIVDSNLAERLEKRERVDSNVFQRLTVQIWRYRRSDYDFKLVAGYKDLYRWTLLYDDFLGYMAGVIQKLNHEHFGTII